MYQSDIPIHALEVTPEALEWILPKCVGYRHDTQQPRKSPKDPRELWSVLRLIKRKQYPACKHDLYDDAEGKVLPRNEWEKETILYVQRQERDQKQAHKDHSLKNIFHMGETIPHGLWPKRDPTPLPRHFPILSKTDKFNQNYFI